VLGIGRGVPSRAVAPGCGGSRPAGGGGAGRNDAGLWVRLSPGSFSLLVAGDAEEVGVEAWLKSSAAAPAEVLVLPHHGRAHGRAAALLAAVRPRLALVSNREADSPSAQGRLARSLGIDVLETGSAGTIQLEAGSPVWVTTEVPARLR
jgi:beta-lactamase superfamily II metal-dependent hydrolase